MATRFHREKDEYWGPLLTSFRTQLQLFFRVQSQHLDGRPTNGRLANDEGTVPSKMFCPIMATRVKQLRHFSRLWIVSRDIATFVQIAVNTSQREILEIVGPTVLPWQNVLNMQRRQRRSLLVEFAVFTPIPRTFADRPALGSIHDSH